MGRPRRPEGWGTINFEPRDGVWYADGRYRDAAGRDRRYRAHGPTPEIADLRLRAKVISSDSQSITRASTVAELADYWLLEREVDVRLRHSDPEGRAGLAAQSLVRYRSDLEALVLPRVGNRRPAWIPLAALGLPSNSAEVERHTSQGK